MNLSIHLILLCLSLLAIVINVEVDIDPHCINAKTQNADVMFSYSKLFQLHVAADTLNNVTFSFPIKLDVGTSIQFFSSYQSDNIRYYCDDEVPLLMNSKNRILIDDCYKSFTVCINVPNEYFEIKFFAGIHMSRCFDSFRFFSEFETFFFLIHDTPLTGNDTFVMPQFEYIDCKLELYMHNMEVVKEGFSPYLFEDCKKDSLHKYCELYLFGLDNEDFETQYTFNILDEFNFLHMRIIPFDEIYLPSNSNPLVDISNAADKILHLTDKHANGVTLTVRLTENFYFYSILNISCIFSLTDDSECNCTQKWMKTLPFIEPLFIPSSGLNLESNLFEDSWFIVHTEGLFLKDFNTNARLIYLNETYDFLTGVGDFGRMQFFLTTISSDDLKIQFLFRKPGDYENSVPVNLNVHTINTIYPFMCISMMKFIQFTVTSTYLTNQPIGWFYKSSISGKYIRSFDNNLVPVDSIIDFDHPDPFPSVIPVDKTDNGYFVTEVSTTMLHNYYEVTIKARTLLSVLNLVESDKLNGCLVELTTDENLPRIIHCFNPESSSTVFYVEEDTNFLIYGFIAIYCERISEKIRIRENYQTFAELSMRTLTEFKNSYIFPYFPIDFVFDRSVLWYRLVDVAMVSDCTQEVVFLIDNKNASLLAELNLSERTFLTFKANYQCNITVENSTSIVQFTTDSIIDLYVGTNVKITILPDPSLKTDFALSLSEDKRVNDESLGNFNRILSTKENSLTEFIFKFPFYVDDSVYVVSIIDVFNSFKVISTCKLIDSNKYEFVPNYWGEFLLYFTNDLYIECNTSFDINSIDTFIVALNLRRFDSFVSTSTYPVPRSIDSDFDITFMLLFNFITSSKLYEVMSSYFSPEDFSNNYLIFFDPTNGCIIDSKYSVDRGYNWFIIDSTLPYIKLQSTEECFSSEKIMVTFVNSYSFQLLSNSSVDGSNEDWNVSDEKDRMLLTQFVKPFVISTQYSGFLSFHILDKVIESDKNLFIECIVYEYITHNVVMNVFLELNNQNHSYSGLFYISEGVYIVKMNSNSNVKKVYFQMLRNTSQLFNIDFFFNGVFCPYLFSNIEDGSCLFESNIFSFVSIDKVANYSADTDRWVIKDWVETQVLLLSTDKSINAKHINIEFIGINADYPYNLLFFALGSSYSEFSIGDFTHSKISYELFSNRLLILGTQKSVLTIPSDSFVHSITLYNGDNDYLYTPSYSIKGLSNFYGRNDSLLIDLRVCMSDSDCFEQTKFNQLFYPLMMSDKGIINLRPSYYIDFDYSYILQIDKYNEGILLNNDLYFFSIKINCEKLFSTTTRDLVILFESKVDLQLTVFEGTMSDSVDYISKTYDFVCKEGDSSFESVVLRNNQQSELVVVFGFSKSSFDSVSFQNDHFLFLEAIFLPQHTIDFSDLSSFSFNIVAKYKIEFLRASIDSSIYNITFICANPLDSTAQQNIRIFVYDKHFVTLTCFQSFLFNHEYFYLTTLSDSIIGGSLTFKTMENYRTIKSNADVPIMDVDQTLYLKFIPNEELNSFKPIFSSNFLDSYRLFLYVMSPGYKSNDYMTFSSNSYYKLNSHTYVLRRSNNTCITNVLNAYNMIEFFVESSNRSYELYDVNKVYLTPILFFSFAPIQYLSVESSSAYNWIHFCNYDASNTDYLYFLTSSKSAKVFPFFEEALYVEPLDEYSLDDQLPSNLEDIYYVYQMQFESTNSDIPDYEFPSTKLVHNYFAISEYSLFNFTKINGLLILEIPGCKPDINFKSFSLNFCFNENHCILHEKRHLDKLYIYKIDLNSTVFDTTKSYLTIQSEETRKVRFQKISFQLLNYQNIEICDIFDENSCKSTIQSIQFFLFAYKYFLIVVCILLPLICICLFFAFCFKHKKDDLYELDQLKTVVEFEQQFSDDHFLISTDDKQFLHDEDNNDIFL
eukprot:TRINITY_DN13757_c0_g1_i1.p1 TRINITY_DN13757_c0_g1~~TRINITY_DN13757_c0_g1_i1.p1  ORF type:complete len:1911 (-),score=361.54 TRINITY_DN13757_c0_g1_i1:235-5967(-)